MKELIEAIKAWPVIIQGALGSAVFWLVLLVGQRIAEATAARISHQSKARQRRLVFDQLLKLRALQSGDGPNRVETTYFMVALLYRASRPLVAGFIWLTLGHIFNSVIGVFGVVGYLGCLYYLFAALAIVGQLTRPSDISKEIAALEKKLSALKNEKSS